MARDGFYQENSRRAFPFLKGAEPPADAVVDAGFVMGTDSGFDAGVHKVWLRKVVQTGTDLEFHFETDAPHLAGVPLVFRRDPAATEFLTEHAESGVVTGDTTGCDEPGWSGYLVTGNLEALEGTIPDSVLYYGPAQVVIEPALVQNLAGTLVTSLALANGDRT